MKWPFGWKPSAVQVAEAVVAVIVLGSAGAYVTYRIGQDHRPVTPLPVAGAGLASPSSSPTYSPGIYQTPFYSPVPFQSPAYSPGPFQSPQYSPGVSPTQSPSTLGDPFASSGRLIYPQPANGSPFGYSMAWDQADGYILLTIAGETWAWNGRWWAQLHPAHASGGQLTYDASSGRIVSLSGGGGYGAVLLTWDGVDWIPVTNSAAFPYNGLRIAYFPEAGRLLANKQGTSEIYALQGAQWTRVATSGDGPPFAPGSGPIAFAYLPDRHLVGYVGWAGAQGAVAWTLDPLFHWSRVPSASGPIDNGAPLGVAYDAPRSRWFLYRHGENWTLDASGWKLLPASDRQPGELNAMTFLPTSSTLLAYWSRGETWSWDGFRWIPLLLK